MNKILFLVTKSNWGGAQRYIYDLAVSLPKRQFSIAVAFGEGGTLEKKLNDASIRTILIKRLERDVKIINEVKAFRSILRLLRKERPDIVHLNSSKMAGLGSLSARLLGIHHIVFTVHGWPFNEDRSVFSKAVIWLFSWMTGLLSTHVITVSKRDYKQAQRMPFLKNKVSYIKNGINTEISPLSKEESRKILFDAIQTEQSAPPPNPRYVIGTIAELTENKGLTYAIDAIAKLRKKIKEDFIYIIVSEGEQRKSLERRIRGLGLTNVVFLPGFIDNAARLVKAFDAFLLPSVKEGMPYVLLESGLAGIPTITTDVGGTSEIIENDKTGIVIPPKSSDAISEALQKILLGESGTQYGPLLQEKVTKDFSLPRMIEETTAIYKS